MAELEEKEKDIVTDRDTDLPIPDILPVLPLKDVVVFPYIILPLSVSREKSINAVDAALAEQRIIMLVAQRNAQTELPRLADLAASNLELKLEDAQRILESTDPIERLRLVNENLAREITVLSMQQEISTQARGEMDRSQREYYLRQQLRAIQQELGEGEELSEELEGYRRIVGEKKIPQEAATEIEKQI